MAIRKQDNRTNNDLQINVREYRRGKQNGQSRETGKKGTRTINDLQINVREYRRGKQNGQSRETGKIGYTNNE